MAIGCDFMVRKRKTFWEWCYGVFNYWDFSLYYRSKKKRNKSNVIKSYSPSQKNWTKKQYLDWNNQFDKKYQNDSWYDSYVKGGSKSWNNQFDKKYPINVDRNKSASKLQDAYEIRRELLNIEWEDRRNSLREKWSKRRE